MGSLEPQETYLKLLQRTHLVEPGDKSHRVFRRLQLLHVVDRLGFGIVAIEVFDFLPNLSMNPADLRESSEKGCGCAVIASMLRVVVVRKRRNKAPGFSLKSVSACVLRAQRLPFQLYTAADGW